MSALAARLEYGAEKHCFLSLSSGSINPSIKQVCVLELLVEGHNPVFCSWSGETTPSSTDGSRRVLLNGLFANKLGINDGTEVILKPVTRVLDCTSVHVEPLSVDDWEILEIHANYVETHLLDQVRVVWSGQVLPVWVNKSICIFLQIGVVQPTGKCALLVQNTEVIVAPKARHKTVNQEPSLRGSSVSHDHVSQSAPQNQLANGVNPTTSMNQSNAMTRNQTQHTSPRSTHRDISDQENGLFQGLSKYFGSILWWLDNSKQTSELCSLQKTDLASIFHIYFKCGFRVQPLKRQSENLTNLQLLHPTNVFIRVEDLSNKLQGCRKYSEKDLPPVFFVRVSKIPSPYEKEELKKALDDEMKKLQELENSKAQKLSSSKTPTAQVSRDVKTTKAVKAIVRVITVEKYGGCRDECFSDVVRDVLSQQPLLEDHVLTSDFLRRQLRLDVTGRVKLESISVSPCGIRTLYVHQLSDLPASVTMEMVMRALECWLEQTVDRGHPLVIYQQMLIKFPIFPELHIEALLTFDPKTPSQSEDTEYAVLHAGMIKDLPIIVRERTNGRRKWVDITSLPCSSVSEFDPRVPTVDLENLGGLSEIVPKTLSHIEMCFAQRPLTQSVFPSMVGLRSGALLVTGTRGAGKTVFVKALCRRVADLPFLAYTSIVECKSLRGKRPETVQRLFEKIFDECAWREPSVIVLDDIDLLASAASGPDAEMTGEVQYSNKMAEVVRDILKCEIMNRSRLAVLMTGRSRSSVHPSLVCARGLHLVHEVVHIDLPAKKERLEILQAILRSKRTLKPESLNDLDLSEVVQKTEGYVPQDLRNVVDRAIHAHHMLNEADPGSDIELDESDFEAALDGFSPASIRNISLHRENELGWQDIGGLNDVKKILIETLEWPSKYPELFSNCPLRLRSGLLLYGAPGTGKTLLARAVAKECGLNFISIKGPELLSKYIGASEQAVRDIFSRAQSAKPCVLFFDEFDAIAPRRGHDSTGVTDRVVNQLLTQLDGVEGLEGVYVLGASSRPDLIDPALLRPGRLDKCLLCPLPNRDERLGIITALSSRMNLGPDVNLELLADKCEHFSGADFKALLFNAQLEAIHKMTDKIEGDDSKGSNYESQSKGENSYSQLIPKESDMGIHFPTVDLRQDTETKELKQVVLVKEVPKSSSHSSVSYIPRLEDGAVDLEPEKEKQLLQQVNQLERRLRKITRYRSTSASISDVDITHDDTESHIIKVNQSDLLKAAESTRPSVSKEERRKYEMIYNNFIKSRGGDFDLGAPSSGKRLTLA